MVIGISSPLAQEIMELDPQTASFAISIFSIFNAAGRPIFGWLTDRITPKYSAIISFVIIFIASIGMLSIDETDFALFILFFSSFWFALGGWLGIAPAATAFFFGIKNHGKNYGIMFLAYGAGAILGTLISGKIRDIFGSYIFTFYPLAAFAILGIVIAMIYLDHPEKQRT